MSKKTKGSAMALYGASPTLYYKEVWKEMRGTGSDYEPARRVRRYLISALRVWDAMGTTHISEVAKWVASGDASLERYIKGWLLERIII